TSRQPLGLPHEVVWRVPLLSVPDERAKRLHQLQSPEACQLFVERARAALRDGVSRPEDAQAIARICRNLNGLPLAIEVAALHAGDLGLGVLADRTTSPLVLGLPGRRDAPARQQSLRATLEWSYAHLTRNDQQLLRRLAVFAGDWTVAMAQDVCGDATAQN